MDRETRQKLLERKYGIEAEDELVGVHQQPGDIAHEYAIETWYKHIREFTFVSEFLDLNEDEAKAIHSVIKSSWINSTHTPSQDDLNKVQQVERRVESAVIKFGGKAFVKLNTRSPKDAVYEIKNDKVSEILDPLLKELQKKKNVTENDELIAFFSSCNKAMMVTSGKQAMNLLCRSSRVCLDILHALDLNKNGKFLMQIIVRRWVDFPLNSEFRGFVCKKQFTALSQYYHFIHFPELIPQKASIEKKIKELYDEVKDLIPHQSYVIDFCILEDKVMIIEINPFHYSTGAPNFGWTKGSPERKTLTNGPFEFRLTEKPFKDAKLLYMMPYWIKYVDQALGKKLPEIKSTNNTQDGTICSIS